MVDVHEFVARYTSIDCNHDDISVASIVQDPCHLRHVQRNHAAVRTVLATVADIVELDDDGLCCGAGGAYSATQPELAGMMREQQGCSHRTRWRGSSCQREPRLLDAPRCCGRSGSPPDGSTGGGIVSDYKDLADRLDAIAEELDELMFDQLREAAAEKRGRPDDDKRLTQARRAIEKAARLLRGDDQTTR